MKKWAFVFFLFILTTGFSEPLQDRSLNQISLAKLADEMGLDGDLLEQTQKHWYRNANKERWQLQEVSEGTRILAINWAKENHMLDQWAPSRETYDVALILGASTTIMRDRLAYLASLWNKGVRFNELVWLTGDRPLDPKVDHLSDRCSNESDGARLVWEEASIPKAMHNLRVQFVAIPMKLVEGKAKRPNTADTIVAWKDTKPNAKTALFVSSQPFCGYQHAVVASLLDTKINFDVVGADVDPNLVNHHPLAGAIILDTAAKWLYQETMNQCSQ